MDILRRFLFVAQLAWVLLLIVTGQSYPMLYLSEKQVTYNQNRKDRLFIKNFSTMTFDQAGEKFGSYSLGVQKSIIRMAAKKDRDNNNKVFSTAFNMATKLPKDLQKVVLFNGNDAATKKFLSMPIGKALEWYAFCQKASRGKLIHLPIFKKKLRDKGLVSLHRPLWRPFKTHLVDAEQGFEVFFGDHGGSLKIATLDSNKRLNGLYFGVSSCCGDALNNFLDDATGMFFQLSMQDILLLMDYDELFGGKAVTLNDLKQLVAIDKVTPFLKKSRRRIRYHKEYSRVDVIDFIKIGAKNGVRYVFPVLATPLCCAGLSKFIEAKFCKKIFDEGMATENALIHERIDQVDRIIGRRLKETSKNDIDLYLYQRYLIGQLRDPMVYSLIDSLKKFLPFLLPIPICIDSVYTLGERDWLKKGLWTGAVLSYYALRLSDSWFVQDGKSFAISMCCIGAFSVVSGVLWNFGKEYFSDNSMINGTVSSDAIESLLQSVDAKNSKLKSNKKK